MGMRRMLLSGQVRYTGRILENVVYLELRRRFGEVYVGRAGDAEVDFVVQGPEGPRYFQVAETVADERTLDRELASLRAIRDDHPKVLLSLDDRDPVSHEGIRQLNALEWLLDVGEG